MASRHIRFTRLVDLIEGRLSQVEEEQLRAQIVDDERATADVRWLERVIAAMRRDAAWDEEPPAEVAARAMRLFRARSSAGSAQPPRRLHAVLHFDSLQLSQPVGIRSGQPAERQLLFTAGDLSLDLRIVPSGALWSLAGQVLGPSTGGGLAALASQVAKAEVTLNELSEFALPPVPAGSYTLTLRLSEVELEVDGIRVG
jgi:hypothetical protein